MMWLDDVECALQDIFGGQSKNSSVTSCSRFYDEGKVESDA